MASKPGWRRRSNTNGRKTKLITHRTSTTPPPLSFEPNKLKGHSLTLCHSVAPTPDGHTPHREPTNKLRRQLPTQCLKQGKGTPGMGAGRKSYQQPKSWPMQPMPSTRLTHAAPPSDPAAMPRRTPQQNSTGSSQSTASAPMANPWRIGTNKHTHTHTHTHYTKQYK